MFNYQNSSRPLDVIVRALKNVKSTGANSYQACCPAHEDRTPSLSIKENQDGKILIKCHSGCAQESVISALKGMGVWPEPKKQKMKYKRRELIRTYSYTRDGEILWENCKYKDEDGEKTFRQRRPAKDGGWIWGLSGGYYYSNNDGKDWFRYKPNFGGFITGEFQDFKDFVPYNLDELKSEKNKNKIICLVEGEKDVENLKKAGCLATNLKNWKTEFNKYLAGRHVCIIPDNDDSGRKQAQEAAHKLHLSHSKPDEIRILEIPGLEKKQDVSDWLVAGGKIDYLRDLIKNAPQFEPPKTAQIIEHPRSSKEYQDQDKAERRALAENGLFFDWAHMNNRNNPKPTIENLKILLDLYEIKVRYNLVKKDIEIKIPGKKYLTDNTKNCSLAWLTSLCAKHSMPIASLGLFLSEIADENSYNPAQEWVESKPWDGVDRFPDLVKTMDGENEELDSILLRRWLISAVAAIYTETGLESRGVLVFQGPQYIGKSRWFMRLTNFNKQLSMESCLLNVADKDSVKIAISHWLTELGEIDSTFRKSDISALKGFISKSTDELRLPYASGYSDFPRRTVFFGSVNPTEFLKDDTGNSRYYTIKVGSKIKHDHDIDMQQMWAQVRSWYDSGEKWVLSKAENQMLEMRNQEFSAVSPIEELILTRYDFSRPAVEVLTATEILLKIGYDRVTGLQRSDCAAVMRKYMGEPKRRNGKRGWPMPAQSG